MRFYDLYQAGICIQQTCIQAHFNESAVGVGSVDPTQYGPVFKHIILCCFFAQVCIGQQAHTLYGAFVAQELLIQVDLADIIEIEIGHVLAWAEADQTIGKKILFLFQIGLIGGIGVGQLIGQCGYVLQQASLYLGVVTEHPVAVAELGRRLHYGLCGPILVFVKHYFTLGILAKCLPGLNGVGVV